MTQNKKIKNKAQFASLIGRLFLILFGAGMTLAANPFDSNWHTSFKGFPLHNFARWGVALIGFIFIYYGLFLYKKVKIRSLESAPLICPMCQTTYLEDDIPKGNVCANCNSPLEQLKGFYERHPEMKNAKENWPDESLD